MTQIVATDLGGELVDALSFAFGMFWETLWALIPGLAAARRDEVADHELPAAFRVFRRGDRPQACPDEQPCRMCDDRFRNSESGASVAVVARVPRNLLPDGMFHVSALPPTRRSFETTTIARCFSRSSAA